MPEVIEPTHKELLEALYFVFDLFSRPTITFFLLDETAQSAREGKDLFGGKIIVGIKDTDTRERSLSVLEAFYSAEEITDKYIKYNHKGVPILVKIIHNAPAIFHSLNPVVYESEWWHLPNPWDEYWKTREKY